VDVESFVCENGHVSPASNESAQFCKSCGAPLQRRCEAGHLSAASAKFCRTCGIGLNTADATAHAVLEQDDRNDLETERLRPRAEAASSGPPRDLPGSVPASSGRQPSSEPPLESPTTAASGPRDPHGRPGRIVGSADVASEANTPAQRWNSRTRLAVAALAVATVAGAGVGVSLAATSSSLGPHKISAPTTLVPSTYAPAATILNSTTSSTTLPTEQQAAAAVASLLQQSVSDRSSVLAAVSDVTQCGPNLAQDTQTFTEAASSRQQLISQLRNLSGLSALPAQMTQALSNAWQASGQADRDFAGWANDESTGVCKSNDTRDPHYQATTTPDGQATQYKTAFVDLWNPIAATYGLITYQWENL
jgi:hypothetical protein